MRSFFLGEVIGERWPIRRKTSNVHCPPSVRDRNSEGRNSSSPSPVTIKPKRTNLQVLDSSGLATSALHRLQGGFGLGPNHLGHVQRSRGILFEQILDAFHVTKAMHVSAAIADLRRQDLRNVELA